MNLRLKKTDDERKGSFFIAFFREFVEESADMKKNMLVFGTRPKAIKMCLLVNESKQYLKIG